MARDRGYGFVIAAFVAGVAAVGIVGYAPLATVETTTHVSTNGTEAISERSSSSIVEEEGWGWVARIALPILFVAAAPLAAPSGRRGRVLRVASTILLFAGVVVGLMSVGIFLLPAAILMLLATERSNVEPTRA